MSAIQNNTVKDFLVKAEGFIEQNKYAETVAYATAGLEIMLDIAKDFFTPQSFKSESSKLKELDEITICYCFDIDVEQYVRYRKMSGYFKTNAIGTQPYEVGSSRFGMRKHNLDKKDAELSLEYCTKTIINIQDTLERFKKPFGEE